jgi:putative membrane protein
MKTIELNGSPPPCIVGRMRTLSIGLTLVVAVAHVWFLLLETLLWTTPVGRAAFAISPSYAEQSAVLAAHMGLANGFLAAGLFYGVLRHNDAFKIFFLGWAVAAGTLGGLTLGPSAFVIEALPALGALVLLLLHRTSRVRRPVAG